MLTIDRREVQEHPELDRLLAIPHCVAELDAGDYAFLAGQEAIGIERCAIADLVGKLQSGRLEEQLTRCSEQYTHVILLVEGVYDKEGKLLATHRIMANGNGYYRNHVYPRTHYKQIISTIARLDQLGCGFMWTSDLACTVDAIEGIYEEWNKPADQRSLFVKSRALVLPTKLTKNPAVPRLMALCPRLPEKVAIRLIMKYGSIWHIAYAPNEELLHNDGFGLTLIRRLKGNLGIEE